MTKIWIRDTKARSSQALMIKHVLNAIRCRLTLAGHL